MQFLQIILLSVFTTTRISAFITKILPQNNHLHLLEAKPITIIKYGGNAMTTPELSSAFSKDIASLSSSHSLILLHGGGPFINDLLASLKVESTFCPETGMRVSTPETVSVAEMALTAKVNKGLVSAITENCLTSQNGSNGAIGLSGRDGNLFQCEKASPATLGNVGIPKVSEFYASHHHKQTTDMTCY